MFKPFALSLPRVSGGVSKDAISAIQAVGLPRVSGGVSVNVQQTINISGSSPRKRGCFL